MTATDSDLTALLAAVEAAPADDAPKLVLADYLADHGAHPDAEAAVRWCVRAGRWPRVDGRLWRIGRYWWSTAGNECLPTDANTRLLRAKEAEWHAPDLLTLMAATARALAAAGHLDDPCDLLGTEAPGF